MKAVGYVVATSLEEACLALGEGARALAGGQMLVPQLKAGVGEAPSLVDLSRLAPLRGIEPTAQGVRIGAMVTHRDVAESAEVKAAAPVLSHVAARLGDLQVRNQATLGGSLCLGHPTIDYGPVLVCLGAKARLFSLEGGRTVAVSELLGSGLKPGELLVEVLVERTTGAWSYQRFPESGWPLCAVCALAPDRVVAGGAVSGPFAMDGSALPELLDDQQASAEYRAHLLAVLRRRALQSL